MKFTRIELPYTYDSLEPYFDKETMQIHYENHHKAYETKLLSAIEGLGFEDRYLDLQALVSANDIEDEAIANTVRNAGGGLINHNFFWESLKTDTSIEGTDIERAIIGKWGSLESFKEDFKASALGLFGSGWTWLVIKDGELAIINTHNQDNPWYQGVDVMLGLDVWEHAYYLKHNSARGAYVDAFWNVINWEYVDGQFKKRA